MECSGTDGARTFPVDVRLRPAKRPVPDHGGPLPLQRGHVHPGHVRARQGAHTNKGDVKDLFSWWFQDMYKNNFEKYALVFLGATKTVDQTMVWGSARELYDAMPAELTYRVDKMFIHPLLGSDEVPPPPTPLPPRTT